MQEDFINNINDEITSAIFQNNILKMQQILISLYDKLGIYAKQDIDNNLIVLYKKETDTSPYFIIKLIKDISLEDVKISLNDFEKNIYKLYKCNNFMCLFLDNIEDEKHKSIIKDILLLENFNIRIEGLEYIDTIKDEILNFNDVNSHIELFSYNKKAYELIKKNWLTNNKVSVIQPTGSGKSYLIAKIMEDYNNLNKLFLSPSHYIFKQFYNNFPFLVKNTQMITYAKSMFLNKLEIENLKPDLIILDEFHRVGAEKWGEGVKNILESFPNAKVLGTSATPIRFLDNYKDMKKELFNNVVASELKLSEAIYRKILPMPKYVTGLYEIKQDSEELLEKINKSSDSTEKKNRLIKEIKTIANNFENSYGVSNILRKYITNERKFIVFCSNIEHLLLMRPIVENWFKDAFDNIPVNSHCVHSSQENKDSELESFLSSSNDEFQLLFSINMINEGIHTKDISGTILLRPTSSPIVFYQQIGRAMQIGSKNNPLIFDLVNNSYNIKENLFFKEFEELSENLDEIRNKLNLSNINYKVKLDVYDESANVMSLFSEIEESLLQEWDLMFEQLISFKNKYGHCNVGKTHNLTKLERWVRKQREGKDSLPDNRILKLESIGFIWNVPDAIWNEMYTRLIEYKKVYGNTHVPRNYKDSDLASWVKSQRRAHKNNTMNEFKESKLLDIGFEFNLKKVMDDTLWNEQYDNLIEYKNTYGNVNVSSRYSDTKLANWVRTQRRNKDLLSKDRFKKLNDLGFVWEPLKNLDKLWDSKYKELKKFSLLHGHCNVTPSDCKSLYNWTLRQRSLKDTLSQDKISKLNKIGYDWEKLNEFDIAWEESYRRLVEYKNIYGDCLVKKNIDQPLAKWVYRQRFDRNNLSEEQTEKLNKIGFIWNMPTTTEEIWEYYYLQLVEFESTHGHCNVPKSYNKKLFDWVFNQRITKDSQNSEQIKKLRKIRFVWITNKK